MPRFFTTDISGDTATITGEDAVHIAKSLRMKAGDEVFLCDTKGTDYRCVLQLVDSSHVCAVVLERFPSQGEPSVNIRLYQAMPKSDKLDFIVQKAVELGVCEIVPVLSSYCVSRPDDKSMYKKIQRLQKIAYEAAKQCGRGKIPQIMPMQSFKQAVNNMKEQPLAIMFYEKETVPLHSLLQKPCESLSILIGSEGGFSLEEAQYAKDNGVFLASLGSRILRCETAAIVAMSAILYSFNEF